MAPAVDDPYASEQLGHAIVALGQIAAGWSTMLPRLLADNAEVSALLANGADFHQPQTDLTTEPTSPPPLDDVLARNEALRAELDQLVRNLAAADPSAERDELRSAIRTHLRASVARFSQ